MRRRRTPEIIAGRVNADGSIAAGDGFTVAIVSTGIYALTFTAAGFRLISVTANVPPWGLVTFDTWTGNSVRVLTGNAGGTVNVAQIFSFIAVGAQQ